MLIRKRSEKRQRTIDELPACLFLNSESEGIQKQRPEHVKDEFPSRAMSVDRLLHGLDEVLKVSDKWAVDGTLLRAIDATHGIRLKCKISFL